MGSLSISRLLFFCLFVYYCSAVCMAKAYPKEFNMNQQCKESGKLALPKGKLFFLVSQAPAKEPLRLEAPGDEGLLQSMFCFTRTKQR